MYLVDTNIFLEILLLQNRSQECKNFLSKNTGELNLTDFSLHSIGVILFRENQDKLFLKFVADILPKIQLISLPKSLYKNVVQNRKKINLDFDDAYQYSVCKHYGFRLTTMDQDFKNVRDIEIQFL
ncbi:MAG: type II toxin-antitoxin system VapC family toxin [bacterium]